MARCDDELEGMMQGYSFNTMTLRVLLCKARQNDMMTNGSFEIVLPSLKHSQMM